MIYFVLSSIKRLLEDYGIISSRNQSFHELYRNHLNIKNVIQNQTDTFSEEFKDLVIRMISYNYLERPTLEQIEEHPWMQGPVPSKEEVKQAMSWLKSKFIQKEVQQQSRLYRTKHTEIKNRPMAKSFKDYALFCIRTNNIDALVKGYLSLIKI